MDEKKSPKVPDGKTVVDLGGGPQASGGGLRREDEGADYLGVFPAGSGGESRRGVHPLAGTGCAEEGQGPDRAPAGDKERLKTEAKAAGLSLNAYLLRKLGIRPEGAAMEAVEAPAEEDAPPPEE